MVSTCTCFPRYHFAGNCSSPIHSYDRYKYTDDLLALDAACPINLIPRESLVSEIISLLCLPHWETALRHHPDTQFSAYILSGIHYGFRIGFDCQHHIRSSTANLAAASQHPHIIDKYLQEELSLNHFLGPFPPDSLPFSVHCSPMGVIPKASSIAGD